MSKVIYESDTGVMLGSFFGGSERGRCLQLTGRHGYVQLTAEDADWLEHELGRWLRAQGLRGESDQ